VSDTLSPTGRAGSRRPLRGIARYDDSEVDAFATDRMAGGCDEAARLANRCLGTLQANLCPFACVLRIVSAEMAVQDVTQVTIDLLFDLPELARAAIPRATLEHGQDDAPFRVIKRDPVDDGRVLHSRFAELGHHLLAGHALQGATIPVLSLGVLEVSEYVATHASALKAHRQSLKNREHNRQFRSRLRSALKAIRTAIDANDLSAAKSALKQTISLIDRMASKGIIHRNAAGRYKSRLTTRIAARTKAA
jgi:small subunit ribosomal protein S20